MSGEVLVRGTAALATEDAIRQGAIQAAGYDVPDRYVLFVLSVDEVASTEYRDGKPVRRTWSSHH